MESRKTDLKNSELNQDEDSLIPIPEVFKDFLIILEFLVLFLFLFIAYLERWRRNIINRDQMTVDFEKLMERANQMKDD